MCVCVCIGLTRNIPSVEASKGLQLTKKVALNNCRASLTIVGHR